MSDAAEVITLSFGGVTFRCSRRTAAHLAYTAERLEAEHASCRIVVIQPCYNSGVAASAGTHDKDAVLDVSIVNMTWWAAQRFLRECGWAAWYRFPPAFSHHIHMVSLGYPGEVGVYVPGQVTDYYAHALGLKGQHDSGSDTSWHPADIDSTVFDYDAWLEDLMPAPKDWDDADKAVVQALLAAELDRPVETKKGKRSLRQMVKEMFQK